MMDGEYMSDEERESDGSDPKESASMSSAVSFVSDALPDMPGPNGYSRPSMRGLQQALSQGWLLQRARDMCSFTHDKYRQAATHMASQQPDIVVMRMCLTVGYPDPSWFLTDRLSRWRLISYTSLKRTFSE